MPKVKNKVEVLAGKKDLQVNRRSFQPFDPLACDFLSSMSGELMSDPLAKQYPDVISFAYWCRRAHLLSMKEQFTDEYIRLGLGCVFHIAPSNVPINFAYSYAFSLLAGNANVVRVPSKAFSQNSIVYHALNRLFADQKYEAIAERSVFIRYEQDDEITGELSADCDARIIWGGDSTIHTIRKLPIPARSIDISFADRYSFCVIHSKSILQANEQELSRLASKFYNDTFLMDQNACSSPHLIVWLGSNEEITAAKHRFWHHLSMHTASKYDLQPVNAIDKYTTLCRHAIDLTEPRTITTHGNYIYRIHLKELPSAIDSWRGKFGYFYEYNTEDLNSVAHIVTNKYQTLTYYGVDKSLLANFVLSNSLSGIDRIVPVGQALDISIIWDGYDLIRTLSRICDIQ
ncbi:acyl-CoA reductase [Brevibacillus borstelensis]|uniref:acyl-CoA reductase n=1 Tax=Brevibacillus borstelensis TaxID=45462 RepID=UPI002E1A4AFE|nr:acyl-CoA reductase [Brevibacillus borstelensis]MED1873011.1 acyl-CoA reductase [Brevibacillus borstelensis]